MTSATPGYQDILRARERIRDGVTLTRCDVSGSLGDLLEPRVAPKLENQQRTGSFKDRGALNRLLTLSGEERQRGVVTASAGNHAQGVALAATRAGVDSTIVMPEFA
ncbi:MAG: pyridoxal-phosphate dependent enzyme, partial [Halobacteriales archaeon]|nr:pyridoxal-phosphate dependent enzyme [Halobacteriales archaeon]